MLDRFGARFERALRRCGGPCSRRRCGQKVARRSDPDPLTARSPPAHVEAPGVGSGVPPRVRPRDEAATHG